MTLAPDWLTPDLNVFTPALWPMTAVVDGGLLSIGGLPVTQAVAQLGTPLYLIDEDDFLSRAKAFQQAFEPWQVVYASKAFLCQAVASWVSQLGIGLDVCSAGELAVALRAGVDPASLVLHGNNKSAELLDSALKAGVGRIVVDADDEIDRLVAMAAKQKQRVSVLLRVTPNVKASTHAHVQTAIKDQKFGFDLDKGLALSALQRLQTEPDLELLGIHCHLGSQIRDLATYRQVVDRLVSLLVAYRQITGLELSELNLGGGFGIAYTPVDQPLAATEIASSLKAAVSQACAQVGIAEPACTVEPGRAIVGPAGVALYTVGTVKAVELEEGIRTYVAVDGGLSDNPRPALYQAEYSAWLANRSSTAEPKLCRVVGQHCETGDVIVANAFLPGDLRPGDLIAVPASGAYQRSMASNYNCSLRPPVAAVREGKVRVLLRRETIDDLLRVDVGRR